MFGSIYEIVASEYRELTKLGAPLKHEFSAEFT